MLSVKTYSSRRRLIISSLNCKSIVYIKSCQYSMFYTNKMFGTRSQIKKNML